MEAPGKVHSVDDNQTRSLRFFSEFAELKRTVICAICLSVIDDPAGLPCQHTFCMDCIMNALKHKESCPICSAKTLRRKIIPLPSLRPLVRSFGHLIDKIEESACRSEPNIAPQRPLDEIRRRFASSCGHSTDMVGNHSSGAETVNCLVSEVGQKEESVSASISTVAVPVMTPGTLVTVLSRTWIGIDRHGRQS